MTATAKCLSACALTLLSHVAFVYLRAIQLSQDDSYHNPYTDISTAFLTGSFVLWAMALRLTWKFRRALSLPVAIFCWAICGLGACYIAFFLICMFMMVLV